jgi:hypothetical protein
MLSALVIGMLEIDTEEIQIMRNQIYAVQAMATAEAGLNDAFYQIRYDPNWSAGFSNKAFNGGTYTVTVEGANPDPNIVSTGTSAQGYITRVKAEISIGTTSPHIIRVNTLRINE